MIVNSKWNLRELMDNIKTLKQEYSFCLAFFSSYKDKIKMENWYKKAVRDMFYSMELKEWQIDMMWEYMNDYKLYQELVHISKIDKGSRK